MSHVRIEEMLSESGLDPMELGDFVVALAPLAEVDEAPAPSAELAELFGASQPEPSRCPRCWVGVVRSAGFSSSHSRA